MVHMLNKDINKDPPLGHTCVPCDAVSNIVPVASLNEEHVLHFLQCISCKIKQTF